MHESETVLYCAIIHTCQCVLCDLCSVLCGAYMTGLCVSLYLKKLY